MLLSRRKKILVIASYPQSLINFRGHLLKKFIENGYSVITCAPDADKDTIVKLNHLGVGYRNIFLLRQGFNPFHDIKSIIHLSKIIQHEKPDIVFLYTIKPVIFGSIAAIMNRVENIYSIITGIGYALYGESIKQKVIGKIVKILYQITLKYNKKVFFQNPDDLNYFFKNNLIRKYRTPVLINGSGVDLDHYYKCNTVSSPIKFLLISRLLKEKGILEFIAAAKRLKKKYPHTNYQIIGWADNSPSRINPERLNEIQNEGIIDFLGFKKDVRIFLENASVYVLPSYREGTPRTVLEAMSMGRPIITTDAPGCRETVINGNNGFLVPIKDSAILEKTMEKFITNPSLISKMGEESRKIAEEKYDVVKINKVIMKEMHIK